MATEPLARLLRSNVDLEPIRDRLREVERLEARYRTIAPEGLASASRVCALDGTTVVIRADNAPVAAALRAMTPRLLEGLRDAAPPEKKAFKNKQVEELTGLRVEVQVTVRPKARPVIARGPMPREKLGEVAAAMADSPLKDALERIAAPQTKRSTRSKR